ncbi:MAG: 23S rRNA (uracil(1939)-C(5))-methyltransferase RlmD [Deltaproteobacteria bacterium]|nr:23S rRNA (uracil(1939)-C(5))-methyltransferase RlmD [Deltaproteobacteria bacterium]
MKNKVNEITIESLAYGGSGVGRLDGKAVFVPLTAPGDRVAFRRVKEKKGYIEGEQVELKEASSLRREPPCPVCGQCGGCSWQHLPYAEQVSAKESIFRETLWRLGTVEKECIKPIIAAPLEWNYRNRAQFRIRFVEGRLHIGFYRRKSHFVIDIDQCPLMSPLINKVIGEMKKTLFNAPFRERMPRIDIAANEDDDRAVAIIHLTSPPSDEDMKYTKERLSPIEGLSGLFIQTAKGNRLKKVFAEGKGKLNYTLETDHQPLSLTFSPGGFTQVNYAQNRRLIEETIKWVKKWNPQKVIDLYCGIGNFSLPLALYAKEVTAVEDYEKAVEDGKNNAKDNRIDNCRFIKGNVSKLARQLFDGKPDMVIIDPPREGAAQAVKMLVERGIPRLIYISCNPTTLARDLRYLTRGGYKIVSSQAVDLFPQTYHIESITVAEKMAF